MSNPDIELIISLQNKELVKRLDEVKSRVRRLGDQLDKSDKGNYSKTKRGLQSISEQLARLKSQSIKFFGLWQGARLGTSIFKTLSSDLFGTAKRFETLKVQLEQLQGGKQAGADAFNFIEKFAKNTPLQIEGVTKAFIQMKALGLDPMDGSLQSLTDANARLGGSQEKLEGIILAVGQAWTKGKLQAEEANQLIERGVPVWDLLSKKLGKTTAELQDMASKGQLGRDVIKGLIDELGRTSQGAAIKQIQTLNGQVSNLQDNWDKFLRLIADSGYTEYFVNQLSTINEAINEMAQTGELKQYAEQVAQAIISMAESLKQGAVFVYDNREALKTLAEIAITLIGFNFAKKVFGWANAFKAAAAEQYKSVAATRASIKAQKTYSAAQIKGTQAALKIAQAEYSAAAARVKASAGTTAYQANLARLARAEERLAIATGKANAAIEAQSVATVGAVKKLKGLVGMVARMDTLFAGLMGYELGTWLYDNFAWARKGGVYLVRTIETIISTLKLYNDSVKAIFNDDTIANAFKRHADRLLKINKITGQQIFDIDNPKSSTSEQTNAPKSVGNAKNQKQQTTDFSAGAEVNTELTKLREEAEKPVSDTGIFPSIEQKAESAKQKISELQKTIADMESQIGRRTGPDEDLQTVDLARKMQDAYRNVSSKNPEDLKQAIRDAQEAVRVAEVLRESGKASQFYLDDMTRQATEIVKKASVPDVNNALDNESATLIDTSQVNTKLLDKLQDSQAILDDNPLIIRTVVDASTNDIARQALKEGRKT